MNLRSWGHVSPKFLVGATLLLLFMETVKGNGICSKNEIVSRTRSIFKTYFETYKLNSWKCRGGYYHQKKHWYYCDKKRTVRRSEEESYTALETVRFCCPGFKKGPETNLLTCEPVCEQTCFNGVCVAPDLCECYEGFAKRNGTQNWCEPVCSEPCENGYCSQPENCSCHAGYQHDPYRPYTCDPICTTPCINAACSSPDTCTCHLGYRMTAENTHECVAHCSSPCRNAVCTAPEECTCLVGYKKDNSSNTCLPTCNNECINAICTGPDLCTCFDGFRLAENYYRCEPVCPDECYNSFCSAPQQCTCFPGYEMDVENTSMCTPICSQECVNANCTAPDFCECHSGFERTDDPSVCKPSCSEGCKNAICTEPEVCTCLWGYQADGNSSSGCSTESDKHECSFIRKLMSGYSYDKTCLFVPTELKIEELSNCKILQEMLKKQSENGEDDEYLSLTCDVASYFTVNEHNIDLKIVCDVVFKERSSTTTDQIEYIVTEEDLATSDEPTSISNTHTSEDLTTMASYEEILQTSVSTITNNKIETKDPDKKSSQSKFEIIFDKSMGDISTMDVQNTPLNLNVTVRFLPVITRREITQSYFNQNSTYLDQEWCLCNNHKHWKLCAKEPTQIYLCPCLTKDFEAQVTGDSTAQVLQTALKSLAFCALVVLLLL